MKNADWTGLLRVGGAILLTLVATTVVGAANCGDTTGAGGSDVPCQCGDTVTTNTILNATDPVASTGATDLCPFPAALFVAGDVTLDMNSRTIRCGGIDDVTIGIWVMGDGATITNGTIQDCNLGIYSTRS